MTQNRRRGEIIAPKFGSYRKTPYLCGMNKKSESTPVKSKDEGVWKENLGKYLIDISKYVVTGVIIASTFKDLDDKSWFIS